MRQLTGGLSGYNITNIFTHFSYDSIAPLMDAILARFGTCYSYFIVLWEERIRNAQEAPAQRAEYTENFVASFSPK